MHSDASKAGAADARCYAENEAMRGIKIWATLVLVILYSATIDAADSTSNEYLDLLRNFNTELDYAGPAPQDYDSLSPPQGVRQILYESGDLQLKAWLWMPDTAATETVPAIVYLHGGFAFGSADYEDTLPFRKAGFAVMVPMLRGENGNPGNYELFLGEVSDAEAAVTWLQGNRQIDSDQIYAFGHSVGGAISALLTLRKNVPIKHSGSSGGIYPEEIFDYWKDIVPFNMENPDERKLRLFIGNQRFMQKRHFAFFGNLDSIASMKEIADRESTKSKSKLTTAIVPGDHFSSLPLSIEAYIKIIENVQ